MAKITLCKTAGFCFGVDRAVKAVQSQIDKKIPTSTLGPIIHNAHVTGDFARQGVAQVNSVQDLPDGHTLVIRSHGVGRDIYDQLEAGGIDYLDATCPFVSKIHEIVAAHAAAGDAVLIAGDPDHPEIKAIVGHSGPDTWVFQTPGELEEIARRENLLNRRVCLAAQTTFELALWEEAKKCAGALFDDIILHNTVCSATRNRQEEAGALAAQSDLMVVIGDRHSSNTEKLRQVCQKKCRTILVETASQLLQEDFSCAKMIGVTAGASTPACIIKEVLHSMSELLNDMQNDDFSFEEALEESLKPVYTGERVKGIVTSVAPNEVSVEIGTKHTGFIPLGELTADPNVSSCEEIVQKDQEINVVVMRVNDQEGTVLLSKKRYDAAEGFEKVVTAYEEEQELKGTVTDIIKGGLLVTVHGLKVFVPASLATMRRGEDLNTLKGQEVDFKIIEVNERRARAIGSIKAVLAERNKVLAEAFWSEAEAGKEYTGTVKSLTSYGAFIDLGGVDGMIHISELSWKRIKHPSEVVKVGDEVNVYIKDIDSENKKISLGYKKDEDNPWFVFQKDYNVGDVIDVTIVSITSFGAFARIIEGVDGLIHISQISNDRVEKVADVLTVGQTVQAKITEADIDRKRVSLSMRALLENKREERAEEPAAAEEEDYGMGDGVVYSTEVVDAERAAAAIAEEAKEAEAEVEEAAAEEAEAETAEAEVEAEESAETTEEAAE